MISKPDDWIIFSIIALVLWGFWAFFPKLATRYMDPKSVLIWEVVGFILVGMIILFFFGIKADTNPKGIFFAILTGVVGVIATLLFMYAISKGKASVVVTMTALYPIVTLVLSALILKETITLKQGIGILFALVGIILMSV